MATKPIGNYVKRQQSSQQFLLLKILVASTLPLGEREVSLLDPPPLIFRIIRSLYPVPVSSCNLVTFLAAYSEPGAVGPPNLNKYSHHVACIVCKIDRLQNDQSNTFIVCTYGNSTGAHVSAPTVLCFLKLSSDGDKRS